MLMSRVVAAMLLLALIGGAAGGTLDAVTGAALSGARDAVSLLLQMGGALCLWSGFLEVMDQSGLSARFALLLKPVIVRLFGRQGADPEAASAIAQNMAANLLGLGSAATPAGLRGARRLLTLSRRRGEGPDAALRLMVLNAASLQLIPTTVAAVRAGLGAARPYDILPAVWLSSAVSVAAGLLAASALKAVWRP